jgi:ADP-ribose pyrophosphatase YjhB (NUDIX family)
MTRSSDPEELVFLAAYDASRYPRPSVAVDVVLLTVKGGAIHALLARRTEHPDLGRWALPGTFLRIDESPDTAAGRVLATKAGLDAVFTEQLYTFGAPDRDPRTRVLSIAYYALVDAATLAAAVVPRAGAPGTAQPRGGQPDSAQPAANTPRPDPARDLVLARLDVPWPGETGGPVDALASDGAPLPLAFDHAGILGMAVKRVRGKLDYAPIGFELLPPTFSLRDLRLVHEAILGRALNKDSFRRRILDRGLVVATGELATGVGHRPPELYRFAQTDRPAR